MKMRFAIIGCGDIAASSYAPSLVKSDQTELVAVCRRDLDQARAFAQRFGGCAAYDSADALLADPRVEAVIVATPTDSHCELTQQAALSDRHVLCEKPMARDAGECRAMIAACKAAGVKLGVAYRRRLFPQVEKAKSLIDSGAIGRIVCVRTHYSGWLQIEAGTWRLEAGIGGALMEMAVHRIEVMLNFAGRPLAVSALVETVHHDWSVDDSDALLVNFADGKIGVHTTILTSPPRRDFVQIDGTEGRIIIESLEYSSDSIKFETTAGVEEIAVTPLEGPYLDQPMIEDFVAAIRDKKEPVCDAETGFWTQAVVDAARRSADQKQQIAVEQW